LEQAMTRILNDNRWYKRTIWNFNKSD
jgi:hypothetical protein